MAGIPPKDKGNAPDGLDQLHARGGFFARRIGLQSPREALQPEAAPPPPPVPPSRRRPTLSALSGLLSFLLIAAVAGMCGLIWSHQKMREPGPLAADKVLFIAPGTELPEIIAQLDREGVIDSPLALNVALVVEGNRSKVKAGEYLFKQNASLRDVMDILVSGKQILHAITIPEGLTSQQIIERLGESDVLLGEVKDSPKEGSILPETYKFTRGTLRADLLRKMQEDQKRAVDQIWAHRASDLPLRSPYELVTLASIVEKETGKADERPRVASVFMNRLQKHMRLQSDPTIVYGLVGGKGTLGRPISRAELDKATPYNTYAIDGLPPGPIANPGRAALEAVANPSRTQDLYFVADGTGGHVFAETLDQHSRNVQRWRQIEKDAKDKPQAPDVDKLVPQVAPPAAPRNDQHSETKAPGSIYGALPASLGTPATANLPSLASGFAPMAIAIAAPADKAPRARADAQPSGRSSAFTMGPSLDDLGITVRGVQSAAGSAVLDGPVDASADDTQAETMTYPVSAARRAEQKARAVKLGLEPGSDELPPHAVSAQSASQSPAPQSPERQEIAHAHAIYDASEGTPLDPLLDKTYDLNFSKNVPSLR